MGLSLVELPPIIQASAFSHRRRRTGLASSECGPDEGAGVARAVPGGRVVGGQGVRIGRVGADSVAVEADHLGRGAVSVAAAEVVGPPVGTSGICDDALVTAAYASESRLKAASLFLAWFRSGCSCSESFL